MTIITTSSSTQLTPHALPTQRPLMPMMVRIVAVNQNRMSMALRMKFALSEAKRRKRVL